MFFNVTRLFQSDDQAIRRLIYVFIKELRASQDEVFIVTSSLMKDILSPNDMYKANSMRVLSRIIDLPNVGSIERLLKNAIVDKSAHVASAALVSMLRMTRAKNWPRRTEKLRSRRTGRRP